MMAIDHSNTHSISCILQYNNGVEKNLLTKVSPFYSPIQGRQGMSDYPTPWKVFHAA
jgi:hypothetical protein